MSASENTSNRDLKQGVADFLPCVRRKSRDMQVHHDHIRGYIFHSPPLCAFWMHTCPLLALVCVAYAFIYYLEPTTKEAQFLVFFFWASLGVRPLSQAAWVERMLRVALGGSKLSARYEGQVRCVRCIGVAGGP